MAQKTVAITGCSDGGIGAALAAEFARIGYFVFATARDTTKMASLSQIDNVKLLTLDVTSPKSVEDAFQAVSHATGGKLDVLVNNAGQTVMYPVLDFDINETKRMYDINVFGSLRVTQVFAPLVIAARGTVTYTCSIGSECRTPYLGVYSGSKAALAQIANTLRTELQPFGVKVITVMTGAVDTHGLDHHKQYQLPTSSIYKPIEQQIGARAAGDDGVKRLTPAEYARQVVHQVQRGTNGSIWKGGFAGVAYFMSSYVPVSIWDSLAKTGCGLENLRGQIAK